MAGFCSQCGTPVDQTGRCPSCGYISMSRRTANPVEAAPSFTDSIPGSIGTAKSVYEQMKNRMGFGDPESNKTNAFESKKSIVPDCVVANENEIPVRQYEVARLRNRLGFVTYAKAKGRIQVTNQRVIFRAPGRCPAGKTVLQHEFAIDEIAGIEARKEYVPYFFDLIIASFFFALGAAITSGILMAILDKPGFFGGLLCTILGAALLLPFFIINKKWLLKALSLGGAAGLYMIALQASNYRDISEFWTFFFGIAIIITAILFLIVSVVYSIRPNLVLLIKNKSGLEIVDIARKKSQGILSILTRNADQKEHTGFKEVLPLPESEKAIREICAMINDIQKLGDFGVEKWQKKEENK